MITLYAFKSLYERYRVQKILRNHINLLSKVNRAIGVATEKHKITLSKNACSDHKARNSKDL